MMHTSRKVHFAASASRNALIIQFCLLALCLVSAPLIVSVSSKSDASGGSKTGGPMRDVERTNNLEASNPIAVGAPQQANSTATFLGRDLTTRGNWKGVYGAEGYNVVNNASSYPAYAQVTVSGNLVFTWAAATADPRALQKAAGEERLAACWYSPTQFTIDINLMDGRAHRVALYNLDWDTLGARSQRVDVIDVASGALLDSRPISNFVDGQYLIWKLRGHIRIKLTYTGNPSYNAVVGGIFFDTSPTAHWKFDEWNDSTAVDSTGNSNNAMVQGALRVTGNVGTGALNFDGVDDVAKVTDTAAIGAIKDNFTLSFWAYPQASHEFDVEASSGATGVSGQRYAWGPRWYSQESGNAGAGVSVGTNGVSVYEHAGYYMPATLVHQTPVSGWTHITVVYENKQPRLYVNGRLARVGLVSRKNSVYVMPSDIGGMPYGQFSGQLDDVRVYDTVLSESQVAALAQAPGKLVAHWKFDEAGGVSASDATGNGSDGTIQGASRVAGNTGAGALDFDGVDDYVQVTSDAAVASVRDNFTLAFWAYPRSAHEIDPESSSGVGGVWGQKYAWGPRGTNAGAGVSVGTNGVSVYEHDDGYMPATLVHQTPVSGWTHIAVVYQNRQPKLYLNGTLVRVGQTSAKGSVSVRPSDIGGMVYGYFDGQLDDMRVYDGALDAEQVAAVARQRMNVALSANGALASASSFYSANYSAAATINGDRKGIHWGTDPSTGSGWHTAAYNSFPDWLQIDFDGSKTINGIDVVTVQDNYTSPSEPTLTMLFEAYGLTSYDVQYWGGASWQTVPGASVSGTSLVWKKFTFAPITTDKIRVLTNASIDGYSRLTEVEAWATTAPPPNQPPVANSGGPYQGTVGVPVQFYASGSFDPDGKISTYQWDFGDGVIGTGPSQTHAYSVAGNYTARLTVKDNASGIGSSASSVTITSQRNGATFVSQSVPATMAAGQAYSVSVTMRNSGTSTWSSVGGYRLGSQNLPDNSTWGPNRANAINTVAPNGDITYNFAVTAPPTEGTYNFQWRMVQDGVEWFGDATPNVAVTVTPPSHNFMAPALDPRNRTGKPGVDLLSGNSNWGLPLVGLAGRAGLDLDLSLVYNSLVWVKSDNGIAVQFDTARGFPSPGFRLGFPVIRGPYTNARGESAYLMIMSSGENVELRQVGASTYEATDSSLLQLTIKTVKTTTTITARTADGTQLSYVQHARDKDYKCTQVKDRNGNYLTAAYDITGRITQIIDTAGRVIVFGYDGAGTLASVTQTWNVGGTTQTHKWAEFEYADVVINESFGGLTMVGARQGQPFRALRLVRYADGSHHEFTYNGAGQVNRSTSYAADGHVLNYRHFDLSGVTGAPDSPRVTAVRDWAENWNGGAEAVTAYQTAISQPVVNGVAAGVQILPTVAAQPESRQESITLIGKEYFAMEGWRTGLNVKSEIYANGGLKKRTTTTWIQDNEMLPYSLNPRPADTMVEDVEGGSRRRTHIDYYPSTEFNLPKDITEYGNEDQTQLRRTHFKYNLDGEYVSRRIIGLESERYLYEANGALLSKVTLEYDIAGCRVPTPASPLQHDSLNYSASFQHRGNKCRVRRWDVNSADDVNKVVKSEIVYNQTGSIVALRDALDRQTEISYADSYSDGSDRSTFVYPTKVTPPLEAGESADSVSETTRYHYDMGSIASRRSPGGSVRTWSYDELGRLVRDETSAGGYVRMEYPASQTSLVTYTKTDADLPEAYSARAMDGMGRVRAELSLLPGSTSGYGGQLTTFDILGRVVQQSNPAEVTVNTNDRPNPASWMPAGDDAQVGWVYTMYAYDWMGRQTVKLMPADAPGGVRDTEETLYGGCGCAGRQVVVERDEVGRRQKMLYDSLGRLKESQVLFAQPKEQTLNGEGAVYSTATYDYNGRDQMTHERQYEGEAAASSTYQETLFTYDGHGRLETEKQPIQSRPVAYQYNADDSVRVEESSRGATTNYTYNVRGLVRKIEYGRPLDVNGQPDINIAAAPTVEFGYDASGNRIWMTDGVGRVDYRYDPHSRMTEETRVFNDFPNTPYKLSYVYNASGAVKKFTDHRLNTSVSYTHNLLGQLTGVTGEGISNVTQFASGARYNASGGIKQISYGNGRSLAVSYDMRLRLKRMDVTGVMGSEVRYYADGRPQYIRNLSDQRGDRAYEYDHVGRLTRGLSGSEARGGSTPDGPYNQTYQYDVWGNLVGRTARLNQTNLPPYSATYVNNRNTNTAWHYNASGVLTRIDGMGMTYDASGLKIRASVGGGRSETAYDGDGKVSKEKVFDVRCQRDAETFYRVRSTVLGGTVGGLDQRGFATGGAVLAGGKTLAAYYTSGHVNWVHENPLTRGYRATDKNGVAGAGHEPDPFGAPIDLFSPSGGDSSCLETRDVWRLRLGDPADLAAGCTADGGSVSCNLVSKLINSGVGVSCANNDCGPRYNPNRNEDPTNPRGGWVLFRPTLDDNEGDWLNFGPLTTGRPPRLKRSESVYFMNAAFAYSGQRGEAQAPTP